MHVELRAKSVAYSILFYDNTDKGSANNDDLIGSLSLICKTHSFGAINAFKY